MIEFIIPERSIVRDYIRIAIAPEPLAPNATILFAAFMASDKGQTAIGEVNPGYTSPYIEGSFSERAITKAGAEILQAPQEVIAAVSDRMNEIILTAWNFPSPVGKQWTAGLRAYRTR